MQDVEIEAAGPSRLGMRTGPKRAVSATLTAGDDKGIKLPTGVRLATPRSALDREAAGWALSLIDKTVVARVEDLRSLRRGCSWLPLGLQVEDSDSIKQSDFRRLIENYARSRAKSWLQPRDDTLARNIQRLGDVIGLRPAERTMLRLAVLRGRYEFLESILDECKQAGPSALLFAISKITGHKKAELHEAISEDRSLLCRSGLICGSRQLFDPIGLEAKSDLPQSLLSARVDLNRLLRGIVCEAKPSTLHGADFCHLDPDTQVLTPFLRHALQSRTRGVNILIHGQPGVGKTEFVRWLAQDLHVPLLEVPIEDQDGDPIDGEARLGRFGMCQRVAATRLPCLVLFDEVEDAFLGDDPRLHRATHSKAWMNDLLEKNPAPAFWLCNHTGRMDPAHLRRFDLVLEMRPPPRSRRRAIAEAAFVRNSPPAATLDAVAAHSALTPAHVQRIAGVVASLPTQGDTEISATVVRLATARLAVIGERWQSMEGVVGDHYRPDLLHTDTELSIVAAQLRATRSGRLCLYGPPGTGKSAFARHLAQVLDRPLLAKRASDLISMWVGGTEQNLAAAFREASEDGAMLLIDEADSFLQDRQRAQRSWEITQVNELLTQMEAFDGIFVATTNLMASLDGASLRRFDYKIRFDWLRPDQAWSLFVDLARELGIEPAELTNALRRDLDRLDRLAPGDFAVVRRRLRQSTGRIAAAGPLSLLRDEVALKADAEPRRVGFV